MLGEIAAHAEDIVTTRMRPPRSADRRTNHEGAHIRQTGVGLQQQPVLFQRGQYALRFFTAVDHWFVPCVSVL